MSISRYGKKIGEKNFQHLKRSSTLAPLRLKKKKKVKVSLSRSTETFEAMLKRGEGIYKKTVTASKRHRKARS